MANILIAEDEERISRFIEKGLKAAGFTTAVVADGVSALDYASGGDFNLLILDVGLPRMDGFVVLKSLRAMGSDIPVIMCTARDSVTDTVAGLEGGADDYLAKPFRFAELLARVKLRLRGGGTEATQTVLTCGSLSLDLTTRLASVPGKEVELSAREFALARTFLENPNQVLTRDVLLSRVWGYDYDGASNVVDVYVRYLRTKLGAERFATVRGVGYRLLEI
ncbi:MAG: response regulator transcription factor [Propionibacterium sp.]|nr:response regulator transcription factor [Propionibacterium sp.]